MSVQSWNLWVCLKEAFVWRPLWSWKSQQEFGRNLSVGRWQIPVQWDVYWFTVFIFGSCFYTWYLQLFLKLLQRIIIHLTKWIYFTRPTGHWFTYFSGNIPLLSELCSLLQGCIHWDVRTSWAMVLLRDLLMCGVTVFLWKHKGHQALQEVETTWVILFSAGIESSCRCFNNLLTGIWAVVLMAYR